MRQFFAQPTVLKIDGLSVEFATRRGVLRAVDNVSLRVDRSESVAIIGESGSGKTTTALSILRLVRPPGRVVGGRIALNNKSILQLPENEMRKLRGDRISMIFQNPMTALDPTLPVGEQIMEVIRYHDRYPSHEAKKRAFELMEAVHIASPRERFHAYPHQLSGGTRQRVTIAMALANDPDLIIADEPTTALDVTVQAQILMLLQEIQKHLGMSLLFITHNLGIAAQIAQRIYVMYAGRVVETGSSLKLLERPHHPYTQGLLNCIPIPGNRSRRLVPISGQPLDLQDLPPGCPFAPRCPSVHEICQRAMPPLRSVNSSDSHLSACVLPP
jgi:oligopeptide/dipeptide ABC transporter ATP-binding protein